jgi:hypothetical protein
MAKNDSRSMNRAKAIAGTTMIGLDAGLVAGHSSAEALT